MNKFTVLAIIIGVAFAIYMARSYFYMRQDINKLHEFGRNMIRIEDMQSHLGNLEKEGWIARQVKAEFKKENSNAFNEMRSGMEAEMRQQLDGAIDRFNQDIEVAQQSFETSMDAKCQEIHALVDRLTHTLKHDIGKKIEEDLIKKLNSHIESVVKTRQMETPANASSVYLGEIGQHGQEQNESQAQKRRKHKRIHKPRANAVARSYVESQQPHKDDEDVSDTVDEKTLSVVRSQYHAPMTPVDRVTPVLVSAAVGRTAAVTITDANESEYEKEDAGPIEAPSEESVKIQKPVKLEKAGKSGRSRGKVETQKREDERTENIED